MQLFYYAFALRRAPEIIIKKRKPLEIYSNQKPINAFNKHQLTTLKELNLIKLLFNGYVMSS